MAQQFLVPINLNKNEIQNARFQNLATAPSNPVKGQYYFNTGTNMLMIYDGTKWITSGSLIEIINNLTTATAGQGALDAYQGKVLNDKITTNTTKLSGIEDGAQVNKIETIKRNGTALPISNKSVDITVPTKFSDMTDDTLGTAAYKNIGTSSGNIPILDSNGKLDTSILPPLALTDTFVVNSQSAMLALTAQPGDVCVRTDLNKTFILKTTPASTLSNWQELLTPTDAVQSVNGLTGTVVLNGSNINATYGSATNTLNTILGTIYNAIGSISSLMVSYTDIVIPGGSTSATLQLPNPEVRYYMAQVWDLTTGEQVFCDITRDLTNKTITITMSQTIPDDRYILHILTTGIPD